MKKYFAIISIFLIGSILSFITFQKSVNNPNQIKIQSHSLKTKAMSFKEFKSTVSISAIGDVLIHHPVYEDAKIKDGVYDFKPIIKNVKNLLSDADFTMANQESMIGGTELGLSSYPSFNSPFEVADALHDAGVDLVSIANNHTLDRGEAAILNAISHYQNIGMYYVGSYKNREDAHTLRVINVNGIKLGFLSYTYGTNGIPVPKDKPYLVNLIDRQKIKEDLQRLKHEADVIIVNMHWGIEYQPYPTEEQKQLAKFLTNHGAHVIIGHHPHVLQPMEWVEGENGQKSIVIYSLGNFLSAQKGNGKDIGGIFTLQIEKKMNGDSKNLTLRNPQIIPTIVLSHGSRNYQIQVLKDINEKKYDEVIKHMEQWIQTNEETIVQ